MIEWQEDCMIEPPLRKKLSETELKNNIWSKIPICFLSFLCHTQAVERTVKLLTGASQEAIRNVNRDGYVNGLLIYIQLKITLF